LERNNRLGDVVLAGMIIFDNIKMGVKEKGWAGVD
jgi:hypothetical protein